MKKILLVFLSLLFLYGCSSNDKPENAKTVVSASDEIISSKDNSSEDSSNDNQTQHKEVIPPHMDFGTLDESSFLSYDAYFSETKSYTIGVNLFPYMTWKFENEEYYIKETSSHLVVMDSSNQIVHQIAALSDYPNCIWAAADGYWIYGVRDETELFRINMNAEQYEVLFNDGIHTVSTFVRQIAIADYCTLFFWVKDDTNAIIYRLYLPEMTLDVLYEGEAEDVFLSWIISNNELVWAETNPEFTALVETITTDPESKYYGMHQTDMASDEYMIPREYHHYINTYTGENYSIAMYFVYSERSPENIQNNGMRWWKDFQ